MHILIKISIILIIEAMEDAGWEFLKDFCDNFVIFNCSCFNFWMMQISIESSRKQYLSLHGDDVDSG